MVVVTGTKRSGTSLWMQILAAAGLPWIGSEWPYRWQVSIGAANPGGFYESLFREGIHHKTNPHPQTGRFLHPDAVRRHAVKVFVPGLVKSDFGYLDHVVATVRPWQAYRESVTALWALEDRHLQRTSGNEAVLRARRHRSRLPPALEWWTHNYALVRDVSVRRYPYHLIALDTLLAEPRATIGGVLNALGGGNLDEAVSVVQPTRPRTAPTTAVDEHVSQRHLVTFDALYQTIAARQPLSAGLIRDLNRTNAHVTDRIEHLLACDKVTAG